MKPELQGGEFLFDAGVTCLEGHYQSGACEEGTHPVGCLKS